MHKRAWGATARLCSRGLLWGVLWSAFFLIAVPTGTAAAASSPPALAVRTPGGDDGSGDMVKAEAFVRITKWLWRCFVIVK